MIYSNPAESAAKEGRERKGREGREVQGDG